MDMNGMRDFFHGNGSAGFAYATEQCSACGMNAAAVEDCPDWKCRRRIVLYPVCMHYIYIYIHYRIL